MGKQLLYMYIDEFYGFKSQGFNFSTDVRFSVYGEKSLVLQKRECEKHLMEGFWGENISYTNMLIGDNGSGKTTLMKVICQWICSISQGCLPQEKGILVFRNNGSIGYLAFQKGDKLELSVQIPEAEEYNVSQMVDFTQDLRLLYFSNTMTELSLCNEILCDCSLYRRMIEANEGKKMPNKNIVQKYNQREFRNQVDTALNEYIKDFPVHYLQIEVRHLDFKAIQEQHTSEMMEVSESLMMLWENYFGRKQESKVSEGERLIIELLKVLLIGVIKYILQCGHNIENIIYNLNATIKYYYSNCKGDSIEDGFEDFKQFLTDLVLDNISGTDRENMIANIVQFVDLLQSDIHNVNGLLAGTGGFGSGGEGISVGQINIDSDNIMKFKSFWEAYKNIDPYMEEVGFSWNASSGERNWVSLFSILTSVSGENIWLLLDEPDNTLHPDWQRKLLDKIIEVCNGENYSGKNVQLWITTHSPIMLSDMPGNAVIYLKDKNNLDCQMKETFGQNIYALFNHAFFLHDGVIGTYASKKIKEVLDKLQNIEKIIFNKRVDSNEIEQMWLELEYCEKIADLLAEPIFKRHMMDSILNFRKVIEEKSRQEEKIYD